MKKSVIIAILSLMAAHAVSAQTASQYFLDHNVYSYRVNPASQWDDNTKAYFGMGLGCINAAVNSNIGLKNLLFPVNSQLVTGLNKEVPADAFLSGLNDNNVLGLGINENLISFGERTDGHQTTVELNLRSETSADIPKDLFVLLKDDSQKDRMTVGKIGMETSNYLELAVGNSFKRDDLFFGFRVKVLFGLGGSSLTLDNTTVEPGPDGGFIVSTTGRTETAVTPLFIKDDKVVLKPRRLISESLSGLGLGMDLGVEYHLDRLRLDLALSDIGAMRWRYNYIGGIDWKGEVDSDTNVKDEIVSVLSAIETNSPAWSALHAGFSAGARYSVSPIFSAGLFLSAKKAGTLSFAEARAGATLTPCNFFSIAATAAAGTFGGSIGCAATLRAAGFNLYAAIDQIMFEVTPQKVPINAPHTSVSAGLVLTFKRD